jgi:preprotein translocase subunit SecD
VQDTAKAKDIIGRTATLEARLADPINTHPNPNDPVPPGEELFTQGNQAPVLLKKDVIFTGDRIIDASAGFDEHQRPSVNIRLDAAGGRSVRAVSRENIGKPMAMVLFEKGKGEVLTVATIQSELGDRFQITGQPTPQAAADLALLLRAGSLAAPMDIIEERTIGPSLGADNIKKGVHSVIWGFCAIAVFMVAYYMLFGVISVIGLSVNLLLLVAVLSLMQATLTLPGIAAIALALGMAIDSNVLINERVREELRAGQPPQLAIQSGYAHAWATILDSNVTTLIAGLALLRSARARCALRDRALPRHPDLDVLRGVLLARDRQPLVRRPQEAEVARDRPGVEAGRRGGRRDVRGSRRIDRHRARREARRARERQWAARRQAAAAQPRAARRAAEETGLDPIRRRRRSHGIFPHP